MKNQGKFVFRMLLAALVLSLCLGMGCAFAEETDACAETWEALQQNVSSGELKGELSQERVQRLLPGMMSKDIGDYTVWEEEPNSLEGQEDFIVAGMTVQGLLSPTDLVDGFKFYVFGTCDVEITAVASYKRLGMVVRNAYGRAIGSTQYGVAIDGGNAYGYSLSGTLSDGTYYLYFIDTQKLSNDYTFYLSIECRHYDKSSTKTAPTCTEQGYTTYKCNDCYETWKGSYVAALGHDMQVVTPAVPHTCTEDGMTALLACSRCDLTEGGEVDPAAHAYVSQGDGVPATSTVHGLTETQICSVCGDVAAQVIIPVSPVATVKVAGPKGLTIKWTDVGADGYVIKRSTTKNGTYKTVATLDGATVAYTDTGLKQGKEYFYIVAAYNNSKVGPAYSLDSAVKSAKPALIKVTGVKGKSNGYNAAKLTWNCQTGADAYRIYMRIGKKTAAAKLVATVKNPNARATLSRVVKSLECGTTYYFEVRAYHGGKEGPASSKVAVKPVPAAAKGLKAVAKVGRKVVLSWTKVSGATGYEIYRSSKETSGYKKIDDVTKNTVTLTAQTANRTFFYKIRPYRTVNGKKIYGPYCDPVSCLVKK